MTSFLLIFAATGATVGDSVDAARSALKLPPAVRIVTESFNNGSTTPFDQISVRFGRDWVHAVHSHAWEAVGLVPAELTYDTMDKSLIFETRRHNGEFSDRFRTTGSSRLDHLSPVAMLRRVQAAKQLGHKVEEIPGASAGEMTWVVSITGMASIRVHINPSGEPRFDLRAGVTETSQVVHIFESWKAIGGGFEHPTLIRTTVRSRDGTVIEKVTKLDQIEALPVGELVPALVLPADSLLKDPAAGVFRSPDGAVLGPLAAEQSNNDASGRERNLFIVLVAGVVAIVAVAIWVRKRAAP